MEVDAFILIGGKSKRFGRDKAFVEIEGQTLAAHAAGVAEAAIAPKHITFVTSSDDQFDPRLLFELRRPAIGDLKPGFGAWSGLHTALAYSQSDWTFVFACDLPFVTGELVAQLAGLINATDAVIPQQTDGRLQPLCAFYRTKTVLFAVEKMLEANRSLPPLANLASIVPTRVGGVVELADLRGSDKFFHNVNTPDDVKF